MKQVTIRDIAKIAGVSPATVSRALSGSSGVSRAKRDYITDMAHKNGYFTEEEAYHARQNSRMIALIAPSMANPFYANLFDHCEQSLLRLGYIPFLFSSNILDNPDTGLLPLQQMPLAGILVIEAVRDPESYISQLLSLNLPLVMMLNHPLRSAASSYVVQDNFQAGYIAARYLIEQGHQRIYFLGGPKNTPALGYRIDGFKRALDNYNLTCQREWILEGDLTPESGRLFARRCLHDFSRRPDALICANDLMAIGFLDEMQKAGKKIPEDISLIGFDDIPSSSLSSISLTTLRQEWGVMSSKAVELLHRQIVSPDKPPENITLDPTLIIRHTVAQKK